MDEQEQQQYEKQIGVEPNQEEQTLAPIEVQQTPTSPSHTKLIVGIVVAVLVVAGVVGAYFFINQRTYIESTAVNEEGSAFDDWKTYRNEEFGFEFQYPEEWSALNQLDNAYSVDFWSAEGNAAAKIMSVNTGIDFSAIGVSYCGAYPKDERCEVLKTIGGNSVTIDWGVSGGANVMIGSQDGTYGVSIILHSINSDAKAIFREIISTFKFSDPN